MPGVATSFTDAMVERDGGRRTFFHHYGANARVRPVARSTWPARRRGSCTPARPACTRCWTPPGPDGGNGWSELLRRARAAGLHTNLELVSLSAERMAEVALPCLPHLDSIVINELEAGALTGIDAPVPAADGPVDWPALEAMAAALLELGVSTLAVVHFPAGAVAAARRAGGPGGRARSGCPAARCAARSAPATRSPPG